MVIDLTFKHIRASTFAASTTTFVLKTVSFFIVTLFFITGLHAQQTARSVQTQNHFWWSVNTNAKVCGKWSVIADLHIRRTDYLKNNSFYYTRIGAGYAVTDKFSTALAVGHMWLANRTNATELFTNENRIVQQFQLNQTVGKVNVSNRLRIEERWVQKIVNNALTDSYRYTTRFRYQLALSIPLSKNKKVPTLALSDELLMQTGKDIVYNSFDQNRLFGGIRQQVTKTLSFDFGYMFVYQQKLSGYQYTKNHTIRWFFYWQPDFRKKPKTTTAAITHMNDDI